MTTVYERLYKSMGTFGLGVGTNVFWVKDSEELVLIRHKDEAIRVRPDSTALLILPEISDACWLDEVGKRFGIYGCAQARTVRFGSCRELTLENGVKKLTNKKVLECVPRPSPPGRTSVLAYAGYSVTHTWDLVIPEVATKGTIDKKKATAIRAQIKAAWNLHEITFRVKGDSLQGYWSGRQSIGKEWDDRELRAKTMPTMSYDYFKAFKNRFETVEQLIDSCKVELYEQHGCYV